MKFNRAWMGLMAALLLLVTGCAPATTERAPTGTPLPSQSLSVDPMEQTAAKTLEFAKTLFGMDEYYATDMIEGYGYEWRVVKRDLEDFPVTMDYRPTRINLTIKEGIVYKVSVG